MLKHHQYHIHLQKPPPVKATPTVTQPPPVTTQSSFEVETVPLTNVRPIRNRKSTNRDDFVYSCYSSSFASFVASTHTWDLVPLLTSKRPIGSRWVYKIKTKSDGSVERYKARIVAKVASSCQWKISQINVKNAFLNGDGNKEVYMKPPGVPHQLGEVCKLRKALYGLKHAPRAWYEKFFTVVTSLGFVSSHHDSAELSHRFAIKDLGL
ncbi:gag-pol polyprotein, partial [Tanacetum coccineum]